jgi:hypothetical protein
MKASSTRTGTNRAGAPQSRKTTGRAAITHQVLVALVVVVSLYASIAGPAQADPYRLHHDYYCLIRNERSSSCAHRFGRSLDCLQWLLTSGRRLQPGAHITQQDTACAHPKSGGVHPSAAKPVGRSTSHWNAIGIATGAVLLLLAVCAGVLFQQRRAQPRPV